MSQLKCKNIFGDNKEINLTVGEKYTLEYLKSKCLKNNDFINERNFKSFNSKKYF